MYRQWIGLASGGTDGLSPTLLKEWVGLEGCREFQFESEDFVGIVLVLFAAVVAPNHERAAESRWRVEARKHQSQQEGFCAPH